MEDYQINIHEQTLTPDVNQQKQALAWIVQLLEIRQIPYLTCGRLAAIAYGSRRSLHDIDIFVPGNRFREVVIAADIYISKPAGHYSEQSWDLEYVQFKYMDVKVEIGNADNTSIFDAQNHQWISLAIDFSRRQIKTVFDMNVPIMSREELISYKSALRRPVDLQDIKAMQTR